MTTQREPRTTETIAALATARGTAALAVLRVSGPDAVAIVDAMFSGDLAEAEGRTVHVGWVTGADGRRVDQVVCVAYTLAGASEVALHAGVRVNVLCLDDDPDASPFETCESDDEGVRVRRVAYRYHDHQTLADLGRNETLVEAT